MLNDFYGWTLKNVVCLKWHDIGYCVMAYVLGIFCTLQHVFKYPCVLFMLVLLFMYHAK